MLLNGKCEGKYRQVIYCCYLTVAESAGAPQIILNLKRQFYPFVLLGGVIGCSATQKCRWDLFTFYSGRLEERALIPSPLAFALK